MHKLARLLLVISTLSAGLLMACGGRVVPLSPTISGIVTQTQDAVEVRAAISRALQSRRFTIESQAENQLVARMDHRGRVFRVQIDYDATGYRMTYLDSVGMSYQISETGQPMIHNNYNRYMARLERTIQDELGRPAREQEEALEEAREQQIALQREETRRQVAIQEAETDRRLAIEQAETSRQLAVTRESTQADRIRAQADADRAAAARAHAEAEVLRQQPPVIVQYDQAPVVVERFSFEANDHVQGSITLHAGFMPDPHVQRGRAAGRTPSNRLGMPSSCAGFWTRRPQHYVTLPRDLHYLRVDVSSHEDTTLAIVTPDGRVWCNDDTVGANPQLAGHFPAGTYAVYVGTYQSGARANYEISMSERRPQAQARARTQAPRAVQAQGPNCQQILLQRGHAPSGLRHCQNAEPYCAQALLERGHAPSGLRHCQNVDRVCAETLLGRGHAPSGLRYCQNVDRGCAVALLGAGHAPSALRNCAR